LASGFYSAQKALKKRGLIIKDSITKWVMD